MQAYYNMRKQVQLTEIGNSCIPRFNFICNTENRSNIHQGRRHHLTIQHRLSKTSGSLSPQNPSLRLLIEPPSICHLWNLCLKEYQLKLLVYLLQNVDNHTMLTWTEKKTQFGCQLIEKFSLSDAKNYIPRNYELDSTESNTRI